MDWKNILIVVLSVIIAAGAGVGWWQYDLSKKDFQREKETLEQELAAAQKKLADTKTAPADTSECATLTDEERALSADWATQENAAHHFSYKHPNEWEAAISNNDEMASFAQFPWGDESLAAVNLNVVVGEKVADYPVGELVEESHRSTRVGCQGATYTVYEKTRNDRWDKDEYHLRATFTKDGVPYLIILNYPFQGASTDGDVVDAYNTLLKTLVFE